ncbi:spore coat protein [Fervidicella metallireducens AeB]|uniref:Spore coat protein n=1 Tax=Fervidicella metallireducens AeB TaxID=1403537 RepID=A0A017S0E9_9CLOT|nr:spore coat protein CotJB [Fervidicella metallireducens]EYE89645.1 spore coat protein [Fervidicella metallireducens AeB]
MKNENERFDLLKRLTAARFMVEDLHLYLDTHPNDREAIAKFNSYLMQTKKLRESYEKSYGMLTAHDSFSQYPWQWINEPWPWDYEANFELNRGEN